MAITRQDALQAIDAALALLAPRQAQQPAYGVYVHAREQLQAMRRIVTAGGLPTAAERGVVDIGLMAAKELEAPDPDFADALMLADYNFKKFA
jgi:Tsi6